MSTAPTCAAALLTPEDLLALPDGDRYELVDGQLLERAMGMQASFVAGRLMQVLGGYCYRHGLGWVFDADGGYQCFPDRPNTVRRPDVSFIAATRMTADQLPAGYSRIAPGLAVEVVSPNEEIEGVFRKADEYLGAGVQLVWVLIPATQTILVIRREGGGAILRAGDPLDGEGVVPGFQCTVAELFQPPPGTQPAS